VPLVLLVDFAFLVHPPLAFDIDHEMARRELWDLESALGLDIEELGALDELCRALNSRIRLVIAESIELISLRRQIDVRPFMNMMVEGGFSEGSAWSRLDDIEEAVGLPEIEDLFDLLSALAHSRDDTYRPDGLTYLAARTGFQSIGELFPNERPRLSQSHISIEIEQPSQFLTPNGALTMTNPMESFLDEEQNHQQVDTPTDTPMVKESYSSNTERPGESAVKFLHRFPNLICLGQLPIDSWHMLPAEVSPFSVRTRNALLRRGITRWDQLLELSERQFAGLPNVGITSIEDLVNVLSTLQSLLREGLSIDEPHQFTVDNDSPVLELARLFNSEQVKALLTLGKWASLLGKNGTLGTVLSSIDRAPAEILEAVRTFRDSSINPGVETREIVKEQAAKLWSGLDERDQTILRLRLLATEQSTLAEIGEHFGVVRERIRQLEEAAFAYIDSTLEDESFSELRWTAWRVANGLGKKAPLNSELTGQILHEICGLNLEDEAFGTIRLINRMRIEGEWLVTGPTPEINLPFTRLASEGFMSLEQFDDVLTGLGIDALFRDEIIASEENLLVRINHVIRKNMAIQDKAYAILSIVDEPQTIEQILVLLDEQYNAGSARNQLSADDRFTRAGAHEWALTIWGVTPYTSIAGAIAHEISTRGGTASLTEIAPIIANSAGVAVSSVRSYATAPMFELHGDLVQLRPPDRPLIVEPSLDRTPNAYLSNDSTLHLSLEVDREILRGSGRQIGRGLTATLGVQPGGSREFTYDGGVVRVTWPLTGFLGGTLGSLRHLVQSVSGSTGDLITVTFDLSESKVALVRTQAAEVAEDTSVSIE